MADKAWNATDFVDTDVIPTTEMIKHSQMHGSLGMGRCATYVVAASDSLHPVQADYVCSGVDDDVQINAVLGTADRKVVLMEGTFNISSGIIVSANNIDLAGQGAGTVISTSTYIETPIYVTGNNVQLRDFKLKKNQGSGGVTHGQGISISSANDVTISNITLEGTILAASPWDATPTWGIHGQYCERLIYDKCHVSKAGYEALTIWEGCTGCIFSNNVSDHCGFGLVFEKEGTYGNTMIGNTIKDSQKAGTWDILIRSTHDNVITGNTIIDQGTTHVMGYAINLDGLSYNNIISGNIIKSATGIGISAHCSNNTIANNTLTNILSDGSTTKAAIAVEGAKGNIIDGNILNYFQAEGIRVNYNATGTIVRNNLLLYGGGGNYAINVYGSKRCTISGNRIIGNDHTGIMISANAGIDVSECTVFDNTIEDPYTDVANTLHTDVVIGATSIQVNIINNLMLGQYIIIEAGASQDVVRIIEVSSDADGGEPSILSITPALSNNHSTGVAITGILKQTTGMRSNGAGTIFPIYARRNTIRNASTIINTPANFAFRDNIGWITENSGTDTVTAATKAVTHGLAVTPVVGDIMITPVADISPAVRWWISGLTSSQFTINLDQAPTNPAAFAWRAIVL